ncbi:hypothetical protein K0M31_017622 [Melipona bicolor]|uniref:Uncharacterized protein n=1 Tax=Melipona bicolor TaxID=60889 RepID=A0AA40G5B4_9HYME|nr:hypothetical protein K0M31_017622 [Melipona bicolor]
MIRQLQNYLRFELFDTLMELEFNETNGSGFFKRNDKFQSFSNLRHSIIVYSRFLMFKEKLNQRLSKSDVSGNESDRCSLCRKASVSRFGYASSRNDKCKCAN